MSPLTRPVFVILLSFAFHFAKGQSKRDYFQQEVNYTIHVTLDDVRHVLRGNIRMEYINRSADSLRFIYFHLWPNSHKDNNTAFARQFLENGNTDFYYTADSNRGYIDSLSFEVDEISSRLEIDSVHADLAKLILPFSCAPGQAIIISSPFKVKIPYAFSRFGHIGQQYQISQWYPKPAVYDRSGWHPMPYLDQGEFFSEFGSFDVVITVPQNYVVAATGELQTASEIEWLQRRSNESLSEITTPSAKEVRKYLESFPPSSAELKTIHFCASRVHDFAWFADKRYAVRSISGERSGSGDEISISAFFLPIHSGLWRNAARYAASAISFYSKCLGVYPYSKMSIVDGALRAGGGMEYPMITVISDPGDSMMLDGVIAHEAGHNWLYGALGFNERDHAWMDEGINSYYEYRYLAERYPHQTLLPDALKTITSVFDLEYAYTDQPYLFYRFFATRRLDQSLQIPAPDFTELRYAAMNYGKAPLAFQALEEHLGLGTFDSLMRGFYDEWKFRHPMPEDFRAYLTGHSTKDLNWFFDHILASTDYVDYKLRKEEVGLTIGQVRYAQLVVKNRQQIAAPYSIAAFKNHQKSVQLSYEGSDGKMTVQFPEGDYDYFRIDPDNALPDINRNNNYLRRKGLFKTAEPLRLQWLGSIDNPQRTQIFFAPLAGWNYYDGFTPGIAFYNSLLFPKKLNAVLLPQYAIRSGSFVGLGSVSLPFYLANSFIHAITFTSAFRSYTFDHALVPAADAEGDFRYMRITQWLRGDFVKKNPRSSGSHSILYRNIFLRQQYTTASSSGPSALPYENAMFNFVTYQYQDRRTINPFDFGFTTEFGNAAGDRYVKLSGEGNFTVTYPRKRSGFEFRVFGGVFLKSATTPAYKFRLSSTTGTDDYLFDHVFLGHSEVSGFLSQQISDGNDGGFRMRTNGVMPRIGESSSWILSINLQAPMPFFMPLFVFADCGFAPSDDASSFAGFDVFQYDAGIGLSIIPGIVEVYWPIFYSPDVEKNLIPTDHYDRWYKRISFTFSLEHFNPFEMIRNFSR